VIDVLVVDDDFRVAEINAAYVGRVPGFRVAARAHTAAQALATLERIRIDLVLLDHYLPDETGLTLVRRMRQLGHHADVIMVTAARDLATVQAAMRLGALQYLVHARIGLLDFSLNITGRRAARDLGFDDCWNKKDCDGKKSTCS